MIIYFSIGMTVGFALKVIVDWAQLATSEPGTWCGRCRKIKLLTIAYGFMLAFPLGVRYLLGQPLELKGAQWKWIRKWAFLFIETYFPTVWKQFKKGIPDNARY